MLKTKERFSWSGHWAGMEAAREQDRVRGRLKDLIKKLNELAKVGEWKIDV